MKIKICFTGGGTAGHVFPGIAVLEATAELSKEKGDELQFFWIGSNNGMEKQLVKERKVRFYGVPAGKLRRYFSLANFTDIFRIIAAVFKSFFILLKEKPSVIFSKGGYVSVPPVLAGRFLGIPVISHESDCTPGLATRINKRFSKIIMVSFEETKKFFSSAEQNKIIVEGNPVRKIFYEGDAKKGLNFAFPKTSKDKLILVIGGSQGALEINALVEAILGKLLTKYLVVHQVGKPQAAKATIAPELQNCYRHYNFIGKEIADLFAAASLVITRAGASSIWELAATGKAAVVIPLRGSGTRGDQVKNALFLQEKGASVVLPENPEDKGEISPDQLYNAVEIILTDNEKKKNLEETIKKLDCPDSALLIAKELLKIAKIKRGANE